jgi:hypothetical protein
VARRPRAQELARVAVHEAGHAVVGYVLGARIQRISIMQVGSSAGHVYARSWKHQRSPVFALAGYAAEELLVGIPFVHQLLDFEGGDLRDALAILTAKHGRDITPEDAEFVEAWARTQGAARAASRRIRTVARLLLDLRLVEGEDHVKRVLRGRGVSWYTRTLRAIHGR